MRQQRFDEFEQTRDAAPIRLDDVPSDGPDPLTLGRVGQQPRQGGRQLVAVRHLQGSALLQHQPRNVLPVGLIGSRQHRQPKRRGLEQIVAADRHQAPADERHIGRRVERRELAHAVHQHDLRGGVRHDAAAPPREAHSAAGQQVGHRSKPVGMPRHQDEQRAASEFRVRRKHLLLFPRVRAARDPRGPCAAERSAQLAPLLDHTRAQFQVELDIADDARPGTLCADGNEALGIEGGLSRHQRTGGENTAKQAAEASVVRNRLRRQPGAREHQRYAAAFALREQIGPELGFHDEGEPRPYSFQESRDRTRCVVGEEAYIHAVAEQASRARPSGGSGARQHQRTLRIP